MYASKSLSHQEFKSPRAELTKNLSYKEPMSQRANSQRTCHKGLKSHRATHKELKSLRA
jgi:hypothetical protein